MGLDMYLTKRLYVKNWDYMRPEEKHQITVKKNGVIRKDVNASKISNITIDVMYWRKDNHIHNWFVEHCQDGQDDCRDAYVSMEQLKELSSIITEILNDHTKAEELLPTRAGFFFGGTDYDEEYFNSLEKTRDIIEEELKNTEEYTFDYYYSSSW